MTKPLDSKTKDNISTFFLFIWAFKLYWKVGPTHFLVYIIFGIFRELTNLAYPLISAFLIDQLIAYSPGKEDLLIRNLLIVIVGTTVLFSFIASVNRYGRQILRHRMRFKPRSLLYEKLKFMGLQFQEDPEILNKITRYREDQWVFRDLFEYISIFIGAAIGLISVIAIIAIYIPQIIPIVLIVSIPSLIVNRKFIRKLYNIDVENTLQNRLSDGNVGYLISSSSFKEVVMIGAYDYLRKIFEDFAKYLTSTLSRIRTRWQILGFLVDMLKQVYLIAAIIILVNMLKSGEVSVGQFVFLLSTIRTFSSNIDNFVSISTDLSEMLFKLKDAKSLLEQDKLEKDGTVTLGELDTPPKIEFENVTFSYPRSEKKVLQNFSLKINSGEKIAIVGHNGAGKTTLIKLLTRLYRPQEGKIEINDTNLNNLKIEDFYQNLGVLFQDYNTYEYLTVRENVALGKAANKFEDEKIWKALEYADAAEFVKEYPKGLDTVLSEKFAGGIRPSTGQWQKIAIARFFYRDAEVLILDEPTASIDAVAEANIFDRIYKFIENKTVIIVSHRFSTVRNADRIIVFEHGQVVEEGSHEQLLAKNGVYANAFNLQSKGYQ